MKTVTWILMIGAFVYMLTLVSPSLSVTGLSMHPKEPSYDATDLEGLAHMAAVLHDLNPDLFIAQMRQESRFNQHAKSKAGAIGVAQIMPETAKGWKIDPHDPLQALDAAAKNMAQYIRTYKAQGHDEQTAFKLALAAYNAGPGAVAKYKGVPPYPETQKYISVILDEK